MTAGGDRRALRRSPKAPPPAGAARAWRRGQAASTLPPAPGRAGVRRTDPCAEADDETSAGALHPVVPTVRTKHVHLPRSMLCLCATRESSVPPTRRRASGSGSCSSSVNGAARPLPAGHATEEDPPRFRVTLAPVAPVVPVVPLARVVPAGSGSPRLGGSVPASCAAAARQPSTCQLDPLPAPQGRGLGGGRQRS